MGVLRSLNTAAAGIRAQGDAIEVVSDNIANVNTTGFKKSRVEFRDILGRSIAGANATSLAGSGATLAHISQVWTQGAILNTEQPTDLAISGNGMFVVKGNLAGQDGSFYTRAGQFHVDVNGMLVNGSGLRLQGYQVDNRGQLTGAVGDLMVNPGTVPAVATSRVDIVANLSADADEPVHATFSAADPANTSNFSQNVTVYDSLGVEHQATVYFNKTATSNTWEYHVLVPSNEITGGSSTDPSTEVSTGTLTFNTDGLLDTESAPVTGSFNFINATPAQTITFDFGASITTDGAAPGATDSTRQFGGQNSVTGVSQDGLAAGAITGLSITQDGRIDGIFTNGLHRTLGQVALASFQSYDGLSRAGDGLYLQSPASGEPMLSAPQSGGRGGIQSQALEQSNVDLGTEFVNLIAFQRGFQANSKLIQASDELYQELVNLRR